MTGPSLDIIEDLQSRLAFQEDAIDHLNKSVAEQTNKIDILQQQLRYLHEQLRQMSEQNSEASSVEIPPHY
jgi:SlyX protein